MKITKRRLDQIIQEVYDTMLQEQELHMRRSAPSGPAGALASLADSAVGAYAKYKDYEGDVMTDPQTRAGDSNTKIVHVSRREDAGRLEEQRLNQLIQEEFDKMLLESGFGAARDAAVKTGEKFGKKYLINLLRNSPNSKVKALGHFLGYFDKAVKGAKSAGKGVTLSDQYGTPDESGVSGAAQASMQLKTAGTGASDVCFTQRCRNQRNYRRRMASNASMRAIAAQHRAMTGAQMAAEPTKMVRVPNEEERTDAWRAQILDAAGWLTSVPDPTGATQGLGILASVAGAAMPEIDKAAIKAATEDELAAAAVNVTSTRAPGPDSHRAPVRQRTSGTYLTPERAKEEASFWGG